MGTHCRLYLAIVSLLLATGLQQVHSTGTFELKLLRLSGAAAVVADSFRVCVKNYEAFVSRFSPCIIGEDLLAATRLQSDTPIAFYFNFTWPGSFSLIIEAYKSDSESDRSLVSRFIAQRHLSAGQEWTAEKLKNGSLVTLDLSYRVRCEAHYYGPSCDTLCKPRNDMFGHYTCRHSDGTKLCIPGWTGDYCNEAMCLPDCHPVHGQCTQPNKCDCRPGWQGELCDTCVRYPGCMHGTCNDAWQCNCNEGWGGLFCDQDLNYCTNHRPCKNGGTCTNTGQGSYTCSCAPEYMGKDCDVLRNPCQDNPCQNGGTCKNPFEGNYTCMCNMGFYGPNCETSASICTDNPCENGGICVHDPGGFVCSCPKGFHGARCEKTTPKCTPGLCYNGGICSEHSDGHYCRCPTGFQGIHCEQAVSCAKHVCFNNGTCYEQNGLVYCDCIDGFAGSQCEININDCLTEPCKNGGVCHDGFNDYECTCKEGYGGKNCTELKDHCSSSPCLNGAWCQNLLNQTFLCHCPKGYSGTFCQVNLMIINPTKNSQRETTKEDSSHLGQVDNPTAISNVSHRVSDEPVPLSQRQVALTIALSTMLPVLALLACAIAIFCKCRRHVEPKPKECEDIEEDEQKQNEKNTLHMNNKCAVSQKIVNTLDRAPAKVSNEVPAKVLNTDVDKKLQDKNIARVQRTLDRLERGNGYGNSNLKTSQGWSGCTSGRSIYVIEDHYRSHSSSLDISDDHLQSHQPSLCAEMQDEDVLATEV